MTANAVFCIAFSRLQADQMVRRLKGAAFSSLDISVLSGSGPLLSLWSDMAGGLAQQGVPETNARLYQDSVRNGHTLVSVQAGSKGELALATEILSKAGGNHLCASENSPFSIAPPETRRPAPLSLV